MSRVVYNVPQPIQPPDGDPVYTKAEIYRAPNVGGVAGAYALIATVTGSTTGKWFFRYEDDGAASTLDDWYKHRFTDTAVAEFSDYSVEIQTDEHLALLWALADITDDDITIDEVMQWSDQLIGDLWPEFWIYYPASAAERTVATITPTKVLVATAIDEYYDIPSEIEEVARIEEIDPTTKHHKRWLYFGTEWDQFDRQVRILGIAVTTQRFILHGKRRLRDMIDMSEAFNQLIYWGVRKQYLDWRVNKRANTPRFQVFDRKSDTTPEQLKDFLREATNEVTLRMAKLRPQEFSYDYPDGISA